MLKAVDDGLVLKARSKLVSVWRVKSNMMQPCGIALVAVRKLTYGKGTPTDISS